MEDRWLRNKSWGSSYGEVYNFFHTQVFFFFSTKMATLFSYNIQCKYLGGGFQVFKFFWVTFTQHSANKC